MSSRTVRIGTLTIGGMPRYAWKVCLPPLWEICVPVQKK